ncbi:hypothetical protein BHE74_00043587 [Ensete ventricosum]|nr:hypothetical protein BHE74_00043587 [Ensete ventricosum]
MEGCGYPRMDDSFTEINIRVGVASSPADDEDAIPSLSLSLSLSLRVQNGRCCCPLSPTNSLALYSLLPMVIILMGASRLSRRTLCRIRQLDGWHCIQISAKYITDKKFPRVPRCRMAEIEASL